MGLDSFLHYSCLDLVSFLPNFCLTLTSLYYNRTLIEFGKTLIRVKHGLNYDEARQKSDRTRDQKSAI